MKRILSCILAVCLPVFALADPVVLEAPLTGTVLWPEDADQDSAVYIYQYSFPKVAGDSAAAEGINTFFADYLEDVVFAGNTGVSIAPTAEDVAGFEKYIENYKQCLPIEQAAVENKK